MEPKGIDLIPFLLIISARSLFNVKKIELFEVLLEFGNGSSGAI